MSFGRYRIWRNTRKLTPFTTIEFTTTRFRTEAAPLLEEQCNTGIDALIANISYPLGIHRARPRAAFAANDNPINAVQIKFAHRPDQWLDRQKAQASGRLLEMPDTRFFSSVLD